MAITGISSGSPSLLSATRQSATQRTGAAATSPAAQEDKAAVSTTAATMVAEGAPIDLDRVSMLKAAIASRSYRPDPHAIAGSMMNSDLGASL